MPAQCVTLSPGEACYNGSGYPINPPSAWGPDAPEGLVIGLRIGGHFYFNTATDKLYVFGGVPGEKTGWVILN